MTLLEIMIVIFIIGIIGSVMGYNMQGSLNQGKAFKTKEAAAKLYEILLLEDANSSIISNDNSQPFEAIEKVLFDSNLVRRTKDIMQDGWGSNFEFEFNNELNEWRFFSVKYNDYCKKKNIKTEYPWEENRLH